MSDSVKRKGPPSGPRPYRRNGEYFVCKYCGESFYRKASFIKRGITKTCGKRECISKSMQGPGNPFWGQNHSEEMKMELSKIKTARPPGSKRLGPPKGYRHTPEARKKISEALRIRWRDNRDKMLAQLPRGENHHWRRTITEPRYRLNFTPYQRENWKSDRCAWCDSTENLELDHIIPIMDGGANIKENSQTLCSKCNKWKCANIDKPAHLARLALKAANELSSQL